MAEYLKNKWYGGISEDDYLGGDTRYLYSENINVTKNAQYIELENKPVKSTTLATAGRNLLEVIDSATNSTKVYAFCSRGKVFRAGNDTVVYDNPSIDFAGLPAFVLNGTYQSGADWLNQKYIYFVTAGNPFKLNRTVPSGWGSVELEYKELADPNFSNNTGVVVRNNKAVMWFGNLISVFTNITGLDTVENFDLTGGEEIAGITYKSGYFRIYTVGGRLLLWDGSSDLIEEGLPLSIKIQGVYQSLGIDYLITGRQGGNSGLYYLNGYTPTILFKEKFSNQLNLTKFNFFTGYQAFASSLDEKIFLIDQLSENNVALAMYGKDIQGLPNAYTYLSTKSSYGYNFTEISGVCYSDSYLYFTFQDINGNKGIDRIYLNGRSTKNSNGSIITNINDLQDFRAKIFSSLYFRVSDITSTQYIEVYKSDNGGDYDLIHTINTMPLDGIVRIPNSLLNGNGYFRDYSLKFKFYSNSTISPKIYNYYLLEYDIKNI